MFTFSSELWGTNDVLYAFLKHVPCWNMFQIGTVHIILELTAVQTLSHWGQTTMCLFNSLYLKWPCIHYWKTNKQTSKKNKCSSLVLLLISLHNLRFKTLHLTCGFDMTNLHSAYLKHISEWQIFQSGTHCQSETCFRMADFQNGTQHTHTHTLRFLGRVNYTRTKTTQVHYLSQFASWKLVRSY